MTDHVHHDVVGDWFITLSDAFATCPLTQGALMRGLLRSGATSVAAVDVVRGVRAADKHEFWPDELGYDNIDLRGVVGYRQVTDAYPVHEAGRLATLDHGLAALHDDVVLLLDTAD